MNTREWKSIFSFLFLCHNSLPYIYKPSPFCIHRTVDLVLVMTVNPGFGGQAYIATMEPKIAEVRAMIDTAGLDGDVDLEVDGGIGPSTIAGAAAAGANVLIAGSALYRDPEGLEHAVTDLRARAEAARPS